MASILGPVARKKRALIKKLDSRAGKLLWAAIVLYVIGLISFGVCILAALTERSAYVEYDGTFSLLAWIGGFSFIVAGALCFIFYWRTVDQLDKAKKWMPR